MTRTLSTKILMDNLLVSNNAILEAKRRWRRTSEEIEKGLEVSEGLGVRAHIRNYRDLHDRYISIARYCDDAERLISFHSSSDLSNQVELSAIDPHLLTAYSEPWNNRAHSGFRFFWGEGNNWAPHELRFPVFTYAGLFQRSPAVLLDAGRSELSETLSYYVKMAEDRGNHPAEGERFDLDGFVKELSTTFEKPPTGSDVEATFFERLMLAGGQPRLRQRLSIARLVGVMKSSNFLSPEMSVRKAVVEVAQGGNADEFYAYSSFIRNNPAILNDVRERLMYAYREFREASKASFDNSGENSDGDITLRGGELHDLNAIIEIHVLNTCLKLSKVPVQLNYVTLSLRMYDFVRQFDKSELLVPILHPRSSIMLHNSEIFAKHREEMALVVSNAIAFGHSIPEDGTITHEEIDRFESEFGDTLEATKNTFVHALADSHDERQEIVRSIDRIVANGSDFAVSEWTKIKAYLESHLELQVQAVGELFSTHSKELADQAWNAYEEFALLEDRSKRSIVLARRFEDKSADVNRLVLLPIGGAYRYLFSIHNEAAIKCFENIPSDSFEPISLKALASRLESSLPSGSRDTLLGRKSTSLKYFMRSVFAASHGQWALAEALATRAHDCFEPDDLNLTEMKEADAKAVSRAMQCDIEVLFLRHLCRRALAYSNGPGRGRNIWLKKSAEDLKASAQLGLLLPSSLVANKTEFDATSVRQALAAFALQIEWLTRQTSLDVANPLDCLPSVSASKDTPTPVAWADLCLSGEAVINAPNLFRNAGLKLVERIGSIRAAVTNGKADGHSVENWRYFHARAMTMVLTMDACVDSGLLSDDYGAGADQDTSINFEQAVLSWREHEAWENRLIQKLSGDPQETKALESEDVKVGLEREVVAGRNPFAAALLSAHRARTIATFTADEGSWSVTDPAGLLSAFSNMDVNCNELNPFGFPRRVIRSVKEKYAEALIHQLRLEYVQPVNTDADTFGDIEL